MDHPQGEFESDVFKEPAVVSPLLSAPDELKKIHAELENQNAHAKEKMIPNHQKRMMFAAQRKLERGKTLEREAALLHRAELVGLDFRSLC